MNTVFQFAVIWIAISIAICFFWYFFKKGADGDKTVEPSMIIFDDKAITVREAAQILGIQKEEIARLVENLDRRDKHIKSRETYIDDVESRIAKLRKRYPQIHGQFFKVDRNAGATAKA